MDIPPNFRKKPTIKKPHKSPLPSPQETLSKHPPTLREKKDSNATRNTFAITNPNPPPGLPQRNRGKSLPRLSRVSAHQNPPHPRRVIFSRSEIPPLASTRRTFRAWGNPLRHAIAQVAVRCGAETLGNGITASDGLLDIHRVGPGLEGV